MGRKLLITLLCIGIIYSVTAYPRDSDSDSDEDTQQIQQQQNFDADSLEQFSQRIKGNKKPEKVQVLEEEVYEPCLEPMKIGKCKAHIPRYYFNNSTKTCVPFVWGGCGKNGNNFKELNECEATCAKHLKPIALERDDNQAPVIEICEKPPSRSGPQCEAYIPRWTYNATQQQCQQIIWGGCGKTENNFATESLCQKMCNEYPSLKGFRGIAITTTPKPEPISSTENVCDLPAESGMCMAYFEMYYFNKLHNRCELFGYGGCGGNRNRFETAEDCVRACGGNAPLKDPGCINVDCPWALYDQYESLGCSPIYDGDACCPTRFECSVQNPEPKNNTLGSRSLTIEDESATTPSSNVTQPRKCRYRGKFYNVGESVEEASDTGSCRAGCICMDDGAPRIVCAMIECPEHLHGRPRGKENCIPLYKRGACCAHDYYCPEGNLTVIEPAQQQQPLNYKPLAKCVFDGEGYYEGQRVYPDKSPCAKCLCEKNPNNATSLEGQLHCEKIDCGIEIYYSHYLAQGCAPVYYEKGDKSISCCPITFECPPAQEADNEGTSTTTPGPLDSSPRPPSTDTPVLGPLPPSPPTLALVKPTNPLIRTRAACDMEKVEGDCKGHRPSYYFDSATGKCSSFVYTGCKGNLNNFASLDDCRSLCETLQPTPPAKGTKTSGDLLGRSRSISSRRPETSITITEVDPCNLPKYVGRCKGYFPRFYFDSSTNQCQIFIFGGCRANGNNFYTKESCEATCLNAIPVENLRTNIPATLAIPMEQRMVETRGDSSKVNFEDERGGILVRTARPPPKSSASESSEETDLCKFPPRTGKCKAFVRRFYYDSDKKQCKHFTYGGCSGNANNFHTLEECDERCGENKVQGKPSEDNTAGATRETSSAGPTSKCKLPKSPGSCYASIPSYYYDAETKSCKLFLYSGCFGNANRFITQEDCESECKQPEGGSIVNASSINQPTRPQVHELTESTESDTESESQKGFCKEDPLPGNCKAKQLRYYYDHAAGQCLPFVYSGCNGNKNNFLNEAECNSICGNKPSLERLGISCTFGNKTIPLGSTVGKSNDDYMSEEEPTCGVPVCQCLTPPAVTCVQRLCPEPTTTTTEEPKLCPVPSCLRHCTIGTGPDGCPTCNCDNRDRTDQMEVEDRKIPAPVKSVKG